MTLMAQFAFAVERTRSAVSPYDGTGTREDWELTLDYTVASLVRVVLPIEEATKRQASRRGSPLEIGFHRDPPEEYADELADRLHWLPGDGGAIVGALSVSSPGAASLRLAIRLWNLGDGELRFFGEEPGSRFAPITKADIARNGGVEGATVWSPVVEGDTVGLEVVLPSSASLRNFSLVVEKISHIHTSPESSADLYKEAGCADHIDVQCRDDVVRDGWEDAVAMIVYEDLGTYVCSGTLLNDTEDGSFIPYFLTAAHCISSQRVANTLAASWFFQRAMCGDGELDGRLVQTAGGANLLAVSGDHDAALLRLRGRLPGGLTFVGWTAERLDHPTDVYGIHHPGGSVKKYSAGATTGTLEVALGLPTFNGISVQWHEGLTEGGSSGSALFRSDDGSLVGTLSGGEPGCFTVADVYGSFAGFFPSVRRWLAPESRVADDYGDTPTLAATVSIGTVRQGQLESGVDVDYFRIELATAGAIRVWTTGTTETVGAIFRDDGRIRIEDDNGGADGNFLIVGNLPAGTYYIEVRGYAESTGAYALEVSFDPFAGSDDHGDGRDGATGVTAGSTVEGQLDWGGDLDYFRIELDKPGVLVAASTGDTDTSGALLDQNGSLLTEDDDGGAGANFRIWRDLAPGTYYVEVRGFEAAATGAYALEISFELADEDDDDHGDTAATATVAEVPSTEGGSLERDGDVDFFRVELAEAATLWVETTGGVDTDGILMSADGDTLREDARAGAELLIADDVGAGTYYVAVRGGGDETTGAYELSIRTDQTGRSGTFRDATDVDLPSSTEGELEAGERDYFRVELTDGGLLRAETTGDNDTFGRLLDEHGGVVASNDDSGAVLNFRIESRVLPGTYYIEVSEGLFGASDPYTLEVSLEEFSPDAVDVEVPSSTEGELEAGERDYFRVELTDGGLLRAETTGDNDTFGRLLDEHGGVVASNDDSGAVLNFRIESRVLPGTYYIEVSEGLFGASDPYTLEVSLEEFSPDAVDVEVPSSTEGELEAGERDYFRVELTDGGLLRAETTGDNDTFGRLLDEHGGVVASNDDSGAVLNFRIESRVLPGTYYIEVSEGLFGASDPYTLEVSILPQVVVGVHSWTSGKIADPFAVARYRFDAPERGTIRIETTGDTDTVGKLLDEDGKVVAENDDGGEGTNFRIARALSPGTYFIEVRGFEFLFVGETGAYTLEIGFVPSRQPRLVGDFDGDGSRDVLLRHADGRWLLRSMDGRRRTGDRWANLTRNRQWRAVALADLNGDGQDDIVLRHADGRWMYHPMDGHRSVHGERGALHMTRGEDWRVAGSGDFDGDGQDDLLLHHTDGRWRDYCMDGRISAVALPALPSESDWYVAGIGDFDGDGKQDLLLREIGGGLRYYRVDEDGHWTGRQADSIGDPEHRIAAVADLNGDGMDDVLLRDRSGAWVYQPMDGHRAIAVGRGAAGITRDPTWRLAGVGDLNGDGNDDVLLRHADGAWRYTAMDGRRVISSDSGPAQLPRDLSWSIPPLPEAGSGLASGSALNADHLKKKRTATDDDQRGRGGVAGSGHSLPMKAARQ